MRSSCRAQREMERSSREGVTNVPGHRDVGPHCPPGPDGPQNKSPPAGASCPCQSHPLGLVVGTRVPSTLHELCRRRVLRRAGLRPGGKQPRASPRENKTKRLGLGFVIPCARKVNVVQLLGNAGAAPGAGRKARVPGGAMPCPPVAAGAAACSAGAAEQAVPAAP